MSLPLIGVTTGRVYNRQGLPAISILEAYIQAVIQGGGVPLMIPLGLPDEIYPEILSRLDGVLFTGGGDIHPELFGGKTHPKISQVDSDRDRVELRLFAEVTRSRRPFLGICRGLQLINVAMGGSLYTHISDQHADALEHSITPDWPRTHLAHAVNVDETSRLAQILGHSTVEVNSLHHQGVQDLGSGLKPVAYAPDGIIEAVELPDYPFGLAVQWHPEWLLEHAPMRQLFHAFVEAAGQPRP
jgi:putative glutamine amidotransferase